jgi:hypothetical protein
VFLSGQSLRLFPWAIRATFFHWGIFKIILIFQALYNDATAPRQGVSALAACGGSHFRGGNIFSSIPMKNVFGRPKYKLSEEIWQKFI